jgi:cytochrome c nitrite reductase small subunit
VSLHIVHSHPDSALRVLARRKLTRLSGFDRLVPEEGGCPAIMGRRWKIVVAVLAAAVVVGGTGGVAFWRYHEEPRFCATCHIMQPYLDSWQASDLGANYHRLYEVECLDCHVPTLEQQVHELVVYVQGDYEMPLRELKYPMEECLQCHEHGSYEELAERTAHFESVIGANPHDSHYGRLECRLCHKMHRESEDYCAQCHAWGWTVP